MFKYLIFMVVCVNVSATYVVDFIAANEGFKSKVYTCSAGIKTIGYGFTDKVSLSKKKMTKKEALVILKNKINKIHNRYVKRYKNVLTYNQQVVLVDFIYHFGGNAFMKSTLKRKLDNSLIRTAGKELLRWKYARVNGHMEVIKGLTVRAKKRYTLWNNS